MSHQHNMNRNRNISIIGVGRLGLCMALCFEKAGYHVLGMDVNSDYVNQINNKSLKSYEPQVEEFLRTAQNFEATMSLEETLDFSNLIFIIVPTPTGTNQKGLGSQNYYDHSILNNLLQSINQLKVQRKHFIICCTVMPGYIENIGKKFLVDCQNCTLSYNPEFIAQGSIIQNFFNPDIVLIGEPLDQESEDPKGGNVGDLIQEVYLRTVDNKPIICRMSTIEAEITKIALNGFITMKIAYANLIGDLCKVKNARPDVVLKAIGSDSRIGNKFFKYGYAPGGPCLFRDLLALSGSLSQNQVSSLLPLSAHRENQDHTHRQAEELLKEDKSEYIFTDICYKSGSKIPIIENSAKLKIAKILVVAGKKVIIEDERQLIQEAKKEYGDIFEYRIV